jgi:hypothetical protein
MVKSDGAVKGELNPDIVTFIFEILVIPLIFKLLVDISEQVPEKPINELQDNVFIINEEAIEMTKYEGIILLEGSIDNVSNKLEFKA